MFMFRLDIICSLMKPYFIITNLDEPGLYDFIQSLVNKTRLKTESYPIFLDNSIHFDTVLVYSQPQKPPLNPVSSYQHIASLHFSIYPHEYPDFCANFLKSRYSILMRILTPNTTSKRYSPNVYWFLCEAFSVIQTLALCHIICHLIIVCDNHCCVIRNLHI